MVPNGAIAQTAARSAKTAIRQSGARPDAAEELRPKESTVCMVCMVARKGLPSEGVVSVVVASLGAALLNGGRARGVRAG
mmetsp:Transcript_54156/g.142649  ORF Transcript_54156/g.142649 Transcript_54156/m.142649 type:complete len:80 (+) Transcript_54156:1217-1456(+)